MSRASVDFYAQLTTSTRLAAGEIGTPSVVPLSQRVSRVPDHHVGSGDLNVRSAREGARGGSNTSRRRNVWASSLFMKGLPDDRCQCPHWGYVIKGKMTARYADRDEVFEAGDAFYSPPGHVPVANEPGTEFVWFSPSEELRTAEAVMMKNMQAMQDGSTH